MNSSVGFSVGFQQPFYIPAFTYICLAQHQPVVLYILAPRLTEGLCYNRMLQQDVKARCYSRMVQLAITAYA